MAKIDQNQEFSEFCHHPFHSGKNFLFFLHGSNAEKVVHNRRWKWRPLAGQQGGAMSQKWLKLTKIFNLFYFAPSNSLWQHILVIFILILCKGVVENEKQGWGPLGSHKGVPKVPKWPQNYIPRGQFWPFLDLWDDLWDTLVDTPGVLTIVYHFLLPPHIRSV